jgi:lycopene cyclase domain-containing protein
VTVAIAIYPATAIASALVVIALELLVFRTGVFRQSAFWVTMLIVYAFMIPVDGWLTAMPEPIVGYRPVRCERLAADLGHPGRGVRVRVRPADVDDRAVGASRAAHRQRGSQRA